MGHFYGSSGSLTHFFWSSIPANPLNAGDKVAAPGSYTKKARNAILVPSFGQNGSSRDFILYSCVPEEL